MRPLILITNDDGILAPGLSVLEELAAELGDVVVCAPDTERSGSSHAITFHTHLRAQETGASRWRVSGTPVDCVYLALLRLCSRPPDLVLSGVNAGYNLGSDVFYSGTVGAAAEGRLRGISAIAVSCERGIDPAWARPVTERLARAVLADDRRWLLNINVPAPSERDQVASRPTLERAARLPIEITRLGTRRYRNVVEHRTDLQGRPYYWIGGAPDGGDEARGEDTYAAAHGVISVTPLELDVTAPDLGPARQLLARARGPEPEGEES